MKKNLLLVFGVTLGLSASAQVGNKNHFDFQQKPANKIETFGGTYNFKKVNETFTAKAAGDTIWSEDFTDIDATGWTIDNGSQNAANTGWATVASSRTWATGNGVQKTPQSTSGGKFLEVMNGAYTQTGANSPANVTYYATSPAIEVPSPGVTVKFQQYGALFNDSQTMEVSVDKNTWIEVFSNNERTAFLGNNPSAIYDRPEEVEANIGLAGLPANTDTIYLRFKWTSRFASDLNPMAWLTFGWMIDDLLVVENNDLDLKNETPFVSSEGIKYSIIPTGHGHEIAVVNPVLNNGTDTLHNVTSYVTMTYPNKTFVDTLASSNPYLAPYAADTIVHSIDLTASGMVEGDYTISGFQSYASEADVDSTNNKNSYEHKFKYGGMIYALDGGVAETYDAENENAEFHVGNAFDMYADAKLTGVDVYLYAQGNVKSTLGTEFFASLREYKDGFPEIARTENIEVYASFNNKWITLVFDEPVDVYNNSTYLVTVGTYGTGNDPAQSIDLAVGYSGQSLTQTSLAYYGSQPNWYLASGGGTPMVRMNFTPDLVSTEKLNESVKANIYPNPANDKAIVDYNTAFDGDVTISVVDLSGRTVYTNTFANQTAGNNKVELDVNNYNAGVYQVVISANSSTITKKLVVK